MGYPCPETMELSPVTFGQNYTAECRCPPKTALHEDENRCYQIFTKGPCPKGYFFGPNEERSNKTTKLHLGACQKIKKCPSTNEIYYPKTNRCYNTLTRGPCPKGLLITVSDEEIAKCECSNNGHTKQNYYTQTKSCFEHFTKGPCKERGAIFLPEKECGCNDLLPHFDKNTEMCYEIGTAGPCQPGEHFLVEPNEYNARCQCKAGYVRYELDSKCYRPYTQGPCPAHHILLNSTTCIVQPCNRGHLYFPDEGKCFRIGMRGPCAPGKLVTFDFDTKPSLEGVSYRGKCHCNARTSCEKSEIQKCAGNKNNVYYEGRCYELYKKGPCPEGAWMAIKRQKRDQIWDEGSYLEGICECIPGFKTISGKNNELIECVSPTEILAIYLNDQYSLATDLNYNKNT
ncbi:uncharacterized protein LOC108735081 isoform X1 [Agrilus planipennis]|nr:uncharacterized protein LOC108735081 isoform X1 [Agrilus planipennis]XP_018322392.1 uncharacterized protein LOC108735081 isoform X1 [Agrilus planipennis]XP_018322393.1 uncharacterized protein LOC108735081 isoform X1 [Agrilus planipennis]XP_018322394.1 uncharacterized protein LOC108735081 isoform X1 [Agrilus planipennis]